MKRKAKKQTKTLPAATPEAAKPWVVKTQGLVAEFFGVRRDTVAKEWVHAGMPGAPGAYDLREILLWKSGRRRDEGRPTAVGDVDFEKLLIRDRVAEVEIAEEQLRKLRLANEEKEGRLVSRDDVVQDQSIINQVVSARLQSIPDELEMEIPREVRVEVTRRWKEKIHLVLKVISECQTT